MKIKSVFFIFILVCLVLGISAVSAENSTDSAQQDLTQDVLTPVEDEVVSSNETSSLGEKTQETSKSSETTKKPIKKIATDTDADDVVVDYKKNAYLKVKVKNDDTEKPIKNLKLKVKVFTKSKSKTYTIKTNSKGIAKFNTKNLKLGNHKVVITSANDKYKVSEKAQIFVGKKHTVTLKPNTSKKLKNKEVIRVYTRSDDDEKEIRVSFKGVAKKTNVMKAVFYLKNKFTGKIIKKVDYCDFDNGKWQYPEEDFSYRYTAVKVKITYVTI